MYAKDKTLKSIHMRSGLERVSGCAEEWPGGGFPAVYQEIFTKTRNEPVLDTHTYTHKASHMAAIPIIIFISHCHWPFIWSH